MRPIPPVIVVICSLIIIGCNLPHSKSLVNEKLYVLSQGNKGGAGELELDFESDSEVKLKFTCIYYSNEVSQPSEKGLSIIRQAFSKVNGNYPYTFKDGILTIPNTNFVNLKLTYNNGFYTDANGLLYNEKSILDLSADEKLERLKQIHFYPTSDGQLPQEILLDSLK